ncbi:MAG TPA: glycosyltransferase [Polyangiaceae bacterium]|jgi:mannosyltransferase OCH1-like enzyme
MVPPIVHTLWPGDDPFRPEFRNWRRTWLVHNPDWSLRFWRTEPTGDSRVDRIVGSPAYTPVFKSDVLRWAVLLEHGGLYADVDLECLRPCGPVLDAAAKTGFLCAFEPRWPRRPWELVQAAPVASNAVLVAAPGHPFVREMLDGILARAGCATVEACNTPGAYNEISGPIALTRRVQQRRDATIAPAEWFFPEAKGNEEALRRIAHGEAAEVVVGDAFTRHHWNAGTRGGHAKMLEASGMTGAR